MATYCETKRKDYSVMSLDEQENTNRVHHYSRDNSSKCYNYSSQSSTSYMVDNASPKM